ncbi:MAG: glycosyltransferase family 4 protein [Cyanobacteria bacterium P01_H01_bin.15]
MKAKKRWLITSPQHDFEILFLSKDLLYFCAASKGGIADYAHYQCDALAAAGVSVVMLCPLDYPYASDKYQQIRSLRRRRQSRKYRTINQLSTGWAILSDILVLNQVIMKSSCSKVIFATYFEYLAPFWAWSLRRHSRAGVSFAAILHDPVRDYVVGPFWWHRLSIRQAYSFLDVVFSHSEIELPSQKISSPPATYTLPHGPYPTIRPSERAEQFRTRLGIPGQAKLLLSFGHLRDNKNLDLVIQAMKDVPDAHLLVAGSEAPIGQLPSSGYKQMAAGVGVASRCHWLIGYQDNTALANCFSCSDIVLVTYASSFKSASGVLSVAASYERPILASCGGGPLEDALRHYDIGKLISPESVTDIIHGLLSLTERGDYHYEWEAYRRDNSWEKNASICHSTFIAN